MRLYYTLGVYTFVVVPWREGSTLWKSDIWQGRVTDGVTVLAFKVYFEFSKRYHGPRREDQPQQGWRLIGSYTTTLLLLTAAAVERYKQNLGETPVAVLPQTAGALRRVTDIRQPAEESVTHLRAYYTSPVVS